MAHELTFHQRGVRGQLPAEGGRNKHTLGVDVIAKAVVVLPTARFTRVSTRPLAVQRRIHIQRRAVAVPTAGAGLQRGEPSG